MMETNPKSTNPNLPILINQLREPVEPIHLDQFDPKRVLDCRKELNQAPNTSKL